MTADKGTIEPGTRGGAPGWHTFWEQYKQCLQGNHVDTSVPVRLAQLLEGVGAFDDVVAREACIPVGFWPKGGCLSAFFMLFVAFHPPPLWLLSSTLYFSYPFTSEALNPEN